MASIPTCGVGGGHWWWWHGIHVRRRRWRRRVHRHVRWVSISISRVPHLPITVAVTGWWRWRSVVMEVVVRVRMRVVLLGVVVVCPSFVPIIQVRRTRIVITRIPATWVHRRRLPSSLCVRRKVRPLPLLVQIPAVPMTFLLPHLAFHPFVACTIIPLSPHRLSLMLLVRAPFSSQLQALEVTLDFSYFLTV